MGAKVEYVYGKHSGAVVVEHALREAGIRPEPDLVAKVLVEVKRVREERARRPIFLTSTAAITTTSRISVSLPARSSTSRVR